MFVRISMASLLFVLSFFLSCGNSNPIGHQPGSVVIERQGQIFICNPETGQEQFVVEGVDPSAYGDYIAYTERYHNGDRRIRIFDLTRGESRRINVNNNNCYGAKFSADGNYLAFNIFNDNRWGVGIYKISEASLVIASASGEKDLFSPAWSFTGSEFVIAHSLDEVYKFSVDGKCTMSRPLSSFIPDCYEISSSTCLYFSPDDRYTYFNATCHNNVEAVDKIMKYDFVDQILIELTPDSLYCWNLTPACQGFLFVAADNELIKVSSDIYTLDVETDSYKLLIKDGKSPSMICN